MNATSARGRQATNNASACRFVLGIVHGLGDHSGRFDAFARWFATRGVSVYCFDQIGHGKSPGKRVVIPSYDFLLRDIESFASWLQAAHPNTPVGLFGQSMGGNLVLNHQLRDFTDAAFVVAGAPMLRIPEPPGAILSLLYRSIALFVPNLTLDAPVDPANLSRNPEVQQAYLDDPLVVQKISLKLAIALIDSGQWAIEHASDMETPALLNHGDADRITCHRASMEFGEGSREHVQTVIWPDGVHDLHADLIQEKYLEQTLRWMEQQLQNESAGSAT